MRELITQKISGEEGVSPVIGVILMVAITVILAAVIGTFVLELGGSTNSTPQAGVDFTENDNGSVTVQLTNNQNADHIWVTTSGSGSVIGGVDNNGSTNGPTGSPSDDYLFSNGDGGAGTTVTVDGPSDGDTITVVGEVEQSDGVIQTYEV